MDEVRIPKQAILYTVGSSGIQERTWQTKDKLERYSEQGHSKNGVKASAQDRQTWRQRVALRIGDAGWTKWSQVKF